MAEAARSLEYYEDYYSSAAPAGVEYEVPDTRPFDTPMAEERVRQRQRAKAAAAAQSAPAVSLFAIFGALFVGVLMVFVILAQISYNEIASETARLSKQMDSLREQQRVLEITFESVIDMKEVERYARDELGMSKPEADQISVIYSVPDDKIEIISNDDENSLRELGSFISSLLEYFKR